MDLLKKKRGTIRSAITRIANYCDSPDANEAEIRARIEKIDEYFEQFENVQAEIEALVSDVDQAAEDAVRMQVEERYYRVKSYGARFIQNNGLERTIIENSDQPNQISAAIDTLAKNQSALSTLLERLSSASTSPIPPVHVETIHSQNSIQLPRIQLPEFDGNYIEWLRFRDLFTALIHDRNNISSVEKFEYLLSHVKGEALSLIKHLSPSNDNYAIAWKLIKDRYDNSSMIKKNYIKLLIDQPCMKSACVSELKRLMNTTFECINALKSMNEQVESWDCILVFQLERKLDLESQTLWCREAADQSLKKFKEFLENRLREFESMQAPKAGWQQSTSKHRVQAQIHTATMKNCPACQQTHFVFQCSKFRALDIQDKIKMVKENRICFNCLQYDHMAAECSRSGCKICNGKHNSLLHKGERPHANKNMGQNRVNINTVYTHDNAVTILPTAIVSMLGADNCYYPCRILLDTGAQTTLVSEACVQRLKLKKAFDKTLLCGIGGETKNYTKGRVELTIQSRINKTIIKTTALCLTRLTQLQPAYQITSKELEFFKDLELADPQFSIPGNIDVILGANVFAEWFLNRQKIHPSGSPSALETIFGW